MNSPRYPVAEGNYPLHDVAPPEEHLSPVAGGGVVQKRPQTSRLVCCAGEIGSLVEADSMSDVGEGVEF